MHAVLLGTGLARFYELAGDQVRTARTTGRSYADFDDPAFAAVHVTTRVDGLAATALLLEDVHCVACVWVTERLPMVLPGVVELRLDVGRARAELVWDPAIIKLSTIARFLDSIGYPPHAFGGADREAVRRKEDRTRMVEIAVAGAAAGNVMLLAAALYAGMFSDMVASEARFLRWTSMLVTLPAIGFAARPFFRGAWAAIRMRAVLLDVPIALGILVALGWGAANTIRDTGEVYFDSIAMLVFFLLVARLVQARQQRRAASAAELLIALTPGIARRLAGDQVTDVPVAALAIGDLVEVRAGDPIAVDGVIISGRSAIDLGLLTGESRPVAVAPGDDVAAGTTNLAARLVVRATATGEHTRIGRIVRIVEEQARRRAPIVRFADKVAARFVIVAIGLAAVTAVLQGPEAAMALLIVTCPCALGLATPMTFGFAIGRAARRGILIKGGDALERLAHPGAILLDKTGTLTEGKLAVVEWRGDERARPLVAALEAESAHPLARALSAGHVPATVTDVRETTGGGIEGTVDGHAVVAGSPAFVATRAPLCELASPIDQLARAGLTPVAIAVDGRVVAAAGLADPLRPDARATIARLRAAGWTPSIVSGDDPRVVARVAADLGIPGRGGVSPEGKLAAVEAAASGSPADAGSPRGRSPSVLKRPRRPVVMVGDGVNDAAALAAATCGIAVHGGAEASAEVADVIVTGRAAGGIGAVAEVVEAARTTLRVVYRNLAISLVYNLVGATLAVTGVIHPLIAAVMMPVSSITIVSSAAWSRAFRSKVKP